MKKYDLICAVCGKSSSKMKAPYTCEYCQGQLEPKLIINDEVFKEAVENGCVNGVWDYKEILPVEGVERPVTLGEGATPLINAETLAKIIGVENLYLKNETLNPSGTYKDRFSTLAVSIEKEKGTKAVALGSAGNAASSVAAYAAKGNVPCFVMLPPGAVAERAWQIRGYGANLIRVENTIHDCINYAKQGEELFGWKSLTTNMLTNPVPSDGYKTISYEIAKQLNYSIPDWIVIPVGGAALLSKIYKGFVELEEHGVTNSVPRIVGAQADNCAPLVDAYERKLKVPELWKGIPKTIAFAIADICAYDGATALDAIYQSSGCAISASDEEILEAMNMIACKEGVVAEPASACSVACLKKMVDQGIVKKEDSVVCVITGNGMRDLKLFNEGKEEVPYIKHKDDDAFVATVESYLK